MAVPCLWNRTTGLRLRRPAPSARFFPGNRALRGALSSSCPELELLGQYSRNPGAAFWTALVPCLLLAAQAGATDLADANGPKLAVPRDNVVFEAGYFIGLKGKHNVLIVRETGSKLPADLGGDIYASLADRADTTPIRPTLSAFVSSL
jgi:hypothetical protein